MRAYRDLALVYDQLMSEIDYQQWVDYLEEIWHHHNARVERILDLACGTGTVSLLLTDRGYQVVGVDQSAEMLAVAEKKAEEAGYDIYWCQGDMRELDLDETFDAVICLHDSLNYMLIADDLHKVFAGVAQHLRPGGFFVFDVNTIAALEAVGDNTLFMEEENSSIVWKNSYHADHRIWEVDLTLFLKQPNGLFSRSKEIHRERGYQEQELANLLTTCGFDVVAVYHALTMFPPTANTSRLYLVARRSR
ncbi:MAG: class I SAM-dependent DNA methyltransferase [Bacillota bacterium]